MNMTSKIVTISIPNDCVVPEVISSFSLEETYLMLKIGCECLNEGRKAVVGLTQKEIYSKIKEETKEEIKKLELNLLVEKELKFQLEETIKRTYDGQIDQLNKKIESLIQRTKDYEEEIRELSNDERINNEINKAKEKYDMLYSERYKQVERMTELQEKLLLQNGSKSNAQKGSDGEKRFEDYAETFKDFSGYECIDKHTQSGSGDFHLHFDEFDVLVDAKNYKRKVPIDQREKIKKDLLKNEHLHFGWLVSLNTTIDRFDKSPIMYEWINTRQCLVYINNLSGFDDPSKILRIVWFTCKELSRFIVEDENQTELIEWKEKHFKMTDKIKNLRKKIRELNTSLNSTRNIIQSMDDDLRECLDAETGNIVESNYGLFDKWWDEKMEIGNDEDTILSTDLWFKFKKDNKDLLDEFDISPEKFRNYLKLKVPTCIVLKSKIPNSAFNVKCLKFKKGVEKNEKKELDKKNEKIISELAKEKLGIVIPDNSFYFDEEKDNIIISKYKELDVLELSSELCIPVFQIVSVLMKHKVVEKRVDARGYEKYKETEEYKSKIKKK